MVTLNDPLPVRDNSSLLYSIRQLLQHRAAMNATQIAQYFSMDIEPVRQGLRQLAETPEVEVLRPIGTPSKEPGDLHDECDYFRWRKKDDRQYLWQIALRHKPILPTCRLFELKRAPA